MGRYPAPAGGQKPALIMNTIIRINRYLEIAKREALLSISAIHRHGAVIVQGNYIVSRGRNRTKSHPVQKKYDTYRAYRDCFTSNIHAEIDALIRSGNMDLSGSEIFLYRVTKGNNVGISKPCKACERALQDAGVSYVYYTDVSGIKFMEL